MISVKHRKELESSKPFAPERLARSDVSSFRQLHRDAWQALEDKRQKRFERRLVIYLSKDKGVRTLGRLGTCHPRCEIIGRWTHEKEWGFQAKVTSIAITDQAPADVIVVRTTAESVISVGEHRFRKATSEQQFCREISHMVRLGLGWAKRWSRR